MARFTDPSQMPVDAPSFGALLFGLRTERHLSQASAARICGISSAYLSGLENDRRPPPPARTTLRLAEGLGLAKRETALLLTAARRERNPLAIADLPSSVAQLVEALCRHGHVLPTELIRDLQSRVEEVAMN
ncbi:helix-turn-helix domain-containing protein [Pelomonas sp. KK5]|uniref:helix-turn-helix domain-containing protein n=1 Tax=Pelomonas sp. KK5 TaxID=1855730 RepID=UPI0009FAA5EE|nr:helix-turn-helix transcriptional regulator [Pelomonas sp. KK5]